MMKNLKKKKGFTLIELIIVIAILGIIAAIAVPRFAGTRRNAQAGADEANAKIIYDAALLLVEGRDIAAGTQNIEVRNDGDANLLEDDGEEIASQLGDNVPTLQAGGNFFVDVAANGAVTVWNGSAAGATQIYPN